MVRAGETRCGANGFENLVDVETSNCPWEGACREIKMAQGQTIR